MFVEKPKRPVIMILAGLVTEDKSEYIIGQGDKLPWTFSKDLKFFKELTMSCDLIVGKNTFKSLPKLEGRTINVISSTLISDTPSVRVYRNIDDCIDALQMKETTKPIFIIGGATIYKQSKCRVDYCIFTKLKLPNYDLNYEFLKTDKSYVKIPNDIELRYSHYESPSILQTSGEFHLTGNVNGTYDPVYVSLSITGSSKLSNRHISEAAELFKQLFIYRNVVNNERVSTAISDDLLGMYNFLKARNEISGDLANTVNEPVGLIRVTTKNPASYMCINSNAIVYYQNGRHSGQIAYHLANNDSFSLPLSALENGEQYGFAIPVFLDSSGTKLSGYELYLFTVGKTGVEMTSTSPVFKPSLDNLILALRPK